MGHRRMRVPMRKHRTLLVVAAKLAILTGAFTSAAWGYEDTSMGTALSVEGGHLVVRWVTGGFHHYNIRWKEGSGGWKQVEREGDKYFRYLSTFRPRVVYRVAVQGCHKSTFSSSTCTSWDEAICGDAGNPCRAR